jgi:hypothetical protein
MEGSSWLPYVTPQRVKYFDPLCARLALKQLQQHPLSGWGFACASFGSVTVHFEHDRGLCYLALGPSFEEKSLCSVEEMAVRFPRTRQLGEGFQRLSLTEQSEFVYLHWPDLQVMFSPEHLAETRRWRQAAGEAFVQKLRRDS